MGEIPVNDITFNQLVVALVFECPSSIRKKVIDKEADDHKKKIEVYSPVSSRKKSFREQNITKDLLTTILTQMRRPLQQNKAYFVLEYSDDVIKRVESLTKSSTLKDPNFELIVMKKRGDMSESEAIFYYIRNAFAHGSFEVKHFDSLKVYYFESSKDKNIKAMMRLRESTLLQFAKLSQMDASQIKSFQKKRRS